MPEPGQIIESRLTANVDPFAESISNLTGDYSNLFPSKEAIDDYSSWMDYVLAGGGALAKGATGIEFRPKDKREILPNWTEGLLEVGGFMGGIAAAVATGGGALAAKGGLMAAATLGERAGVMAAAKAGGVALTKRLAEHAGERLAYHVASQGALLGGYDAFRTTAGQLFGQEKTGLRPLETAKAAGKGLLVGGTFGAISSAMPKTMANVKLFELMRKSARDEIDLPLALKDAAKRVVILGGAGMGISATQQMIQDQHIQFNLDMATWGLLPLFAEFMPRYQNVYKLLKDLKNNPEPIVRETITRIVEDVDKAHKEHIEKAEKTFEKLRQGWALEDLMEYTKRGIKPPEIIPRESQEGVAKPRTEVGTVETTSPPEKPAEAPSQPTAKRQRKRKSKVAPERPAEVTEQPAGEGKEVKPETGELKPYEGVVMFPINKMTYEPEFQFRGNKFSQNTYDKIVKQGIIKAEEKPGIVWEEIDETGKPTGKYPVLEGNSRTRAYKDIGEKTHPMAIFRGTRQEARMIAAKSNLPSDIYTLAEKVKVNRAMEEAGDTPEERMLYFKNEFETIEDLKKLDPNGRWMREIAQQKPGETREGLPKLTQWARWIGQWRAKYPNRMTTAHENQLFKFIYEDERIKKFYMLKADFWDLMEKNLGKSDFNPEEPLVLKKTGLKMSGDKAKLHMQDVMRALTKALQERETMETIKDKEAREKALSQINDEIKYYEQRRKEIREEQGEIPLFNTEGESNYKAPGTTGKYTGIGAMIADKIALMKQNGMSSEEVIDKTTNEIVDHLNNGGSFRSIKGLTDEIIVTAKEAMVWHNRGIRNSELLPQMYKKQTEKVVSDPERQMLISHAIEHRLKGEEWDQLNPAERHLAKSLSTEHDRLDDYIEKNGLVSKETLEKFRSGEVRHVSHFWINPETGEKFITEYGKFTKQSPLQKERHIYDYREGIARGLKPATSNPGEQLGLEWRSMVRANSAREMLKTLHGLPGDPNTTIQLRPNSKPRPLRMVESVRILEKHNLMDSYVRFESNVLNTPIVFSGPDGKTVMLRGTVGIHKDIFPFVDAYIRSPNYGNFSRLNFALKSMKLGISLFHVVSLGMQELANFRIPFVNIPRGLRLIEELDPAMRLLHQEGLDIKRYEDLYYPNLFFDEGYKLGKTGNAITKPITQIRDFIFGVVQPGIKASFAHDMIHKLMPRYLKKTGWTAEEVFATFDKGGKIPNEALQCARQVVSKADGHFSGEHYKRSLLETNRFMLKLYFTPEARKWWQFLMLSPTWQREHLLVAKNVAKSFMSDAMIKKLGMAELGPIKSQYRRYALGGLMIIGAVDLMNWMITEQMDGKGRHLWQNPKGKGFAVRAWWNEPDYGVVDTNGIKKTIRGGAAYFRPLKSLFEVAEWAHDPVAKMSYKVSPFVSAVGDQLFGSEHKYEGAKDLPKRVKDYILDVGTPITIDQVMRYAQGKQTLAKTVMPFVGMPVSKEVKSNKGKEREYYKVLDYMLTGDMEKAGKSLRKWNSQNPNNPIGEEDLSGGHLIRRAQMLFRAKAQ